MVTPLPRECSLTGCGCCLLSSEEFRAPEGDRRIVAASEPFPFLTKDTGRREFQLFIALLFIGFGK